MFESPRISATFALLIGVASASSELGVTGWPTIVSGASLLLYITLEWHRLDRAAQVMFLLALISLVGFSLLGQVSPELLEKAVSRSAFLAFYILSVSFLRDAAQTSRLVRKCGRIIVDQTPSRRYVTLTIGSHIFTSLLNLGAINLLVTMVRRSIETDQRDVLPDIREIRMQRMSMAVLRGFCAAPLWAPTSVTVAIILTGLPELTWFDLLPLGLAGAAVFMTTGWVVDRLMFPRPRSTSAPKITQPIIKPFSSLLAIVILIPAVAFAVSHLLSLRLISALMMSVPFLGLGWIAIQYAHTGVRKAVLLATRRFRNQIFPSFGEMRCEFTIFATSGFLAVLLIPQIDVVFLGDLISRYGLSEGWILVFSSWAIILLSIVAVNPIIVATLLIETLPRLSGMEFPLALLAFMIMVSWVTAAGISPITTSVRLTGRCVNRPATLVGLKWNRFFSVCIVIGLDVFLLVAS